jgi:glycolate oxidase
VEAEGLFYPPDPNSLGTCTLGGNIATNAGGPRAHKYGTTRNWVLGVEAVTGAGSVLQLGKQTMKGVTGYDLTSLVVGSEGTLAVVTRAALKLMPRPETVATMMIFLPDHPSVSRAISSIYGTGIVPSCLEFLDRIALDIVRPQAGLPIPEGAQAMLLVEVDGDADSVTRHMERSGAAVTEAGALEVLVAQNRNERERLWSARRELSYSMRRQAAHKLSEDVVVPRSRIADLLDECARLGDTHGITIPTYGHAGDGNLHCNFLWDRPDQKPEVDRAIEGLFRAVVAMGGTLTGEHGLGLLKAPHLELEQSAPLIELQQQIKRVFDPNDILNPDKCFPEPYRRHHGPC